MVGGLMTMLLSTGLIWAVKATSRPTGTETSLRPAVEVPA
jgi:hypothetical protein